MMKLTELREKKGWSRAELARRAGMSASDVGKIEAGRIAPYDSQMRKLALALRWPVGEASALLRNA